LRGDAVTRSRGKTTERLRNRATVSWYNSRSLKRILHLIVIVAITILFLWLFLKNANMRDVGTILRSTSYWWVAAGFATNILALVFRTIRWRNIIDPDHPPSFYDTFFANAVGYMLSTVLPVRAGDVARPALLSRRTSHRFAGILGTVLTERVLDLTTILLLFVYYALYRWKDLSHDAHVGRWLEIVRLGAIGSATILVVLWFFILGLYFYRPFIRRMHEGLGRIVPRRFRDAWMHFFDTFAATTEIAHHPVALIKIILCTLGVWACLTSQFWVGTEAVHHSLPYDASFLVTGITTVGMAIPTPGGIGGFHKTCQFVLTRFYDFDVDSSVAIAVLFHIIGTFPIIAVGLILFIKEGLRWKDVTRGGDEGRGQKAEGRRQKWG
jgi:uncharacterized protein (TIRG00374 family)